MCSGANFVGWSNEELHGSLENEEKLLKLWLWFYKKGPIYVQIQVHY
jgi:hypothetical protein